MIESRAWLLRLYPPAWRERYEDEFTAVLEQCRLSPMTILDIFLGALDARIAPQDTTGRILQMITRPRRTAITVFCAYIAFVVAGIGFQKLSEYDDFMAVVRAHTSVGIAYGAVVVGSGVALLAVLAGGLPIAYAALRYALANRRRDILLLFGIPIVAFAVLVGGARVLFHIAGSQPPRPPNTPPTSLDVTVFLLLIGLFILLAIASTAAVSLAVARSEIDPRILQFALVPAGVATVAMLVMFVGVVVWGLGIRTYAPHLFNGNDGILATSTALTWAGSVLWMGIATTIALVSLVRGASMRPALQPA